MQSVIIPIENLKCHGCAATIVKALNKFEVVENVEVDIERSSVGISFNGNDNHIMEFKIKLSRLGYPEKGHNTAVSVAKSYVSCAVGRVGEKNRGKD